MERPPTERLVRLFGGGAFEVVTTPNLPVVVPTDTDTEDG